MANKMLWMNVYNLTYQTNVNGQNVWETDIVAAAAAAARLRM